MHTAVNSHDPQPHHLVKLTSSKLLLIQAVYFASHPWTSHDVQNDK